MERAERALRDVLESSLPTEKEKRLVFLTTTRQLDDLFRQLSLAPVSRTLPNGVVLKSTALLEAILSMNPRTMNIAAAIIALNSQVDELQDSMRLAFAMAAEVVLPLLSLDELKLLQAEVVSVAHVFSDTSCDNGSIKSALIVTKQLANGLSSGPNFLTPLHADVLQLAIKGRFYKHAVEFVESTSVLEIDPDISSWDIEDVLRYYYYAGICYVALKKFPLALQNFTTVLCVPAEAASAVAEEAGKKAKLVSLLINGEAYHAPNNVPGVVQRMLSQPHGDGRRSEYDVFAQFFAEKNYKSLSTYLQAQAGVFERDNNLGLAKQVLESWRGHKLSLLAKTFVTLPLSEVTSVLCLSSDAESENVIFRAVEQGGVAVQIDRARQLVLFSSQQGVDSTAEQEMRNQLALQLSQSLQQLVLLIARVKAVHMRELSSLEYLKRVTSAGGHGRSSVVSQSELMGFE